MDVLTAERVSVVVDGATGGTTASAGGGVLLIGLAFVLLVTAVLIVHVRLSTNRPASFVDTSASSADEEPNEQ